MTRAVGSIRSVLPIAADCTCAAGQLFEIGFNRAYFSPFLAIAPQRTQHPIRRGVGCGVPPLTLIPHKLFFAIVSISPSRSPVLAYVGDFPVGPLFIDCEMDFLVNGDSLCIGNFLRVSYEVTAQSIQTHQIMQIQRRAVSPLRSSGPRKRLIFTIHTARLRSN